MAQNKMRQEQTITYIEQLIQEYADCRDELDLRKVAVGIYTIVNEETENLIKEGKGK